MVWGVAQPETVRDFRIEAFNRDGRRHLLIEENGNYQRLWRRQLVPDGPISQILVTVLDTNGLDHARIFEVRIS